MIADTKTLPIQVQKSLPPEALKVFLEGVNKALSHNSYEEVAMAAGWAEVRAAGWERQDGTWITKSEGHDSVWIGLWVPADTAEELALEGEEAEKPDDLHLTLVILGAVRDMAPETIKRVKAIIAKLAEENGPIMGETSGIGRYSNGPGETDVVYASFDSPSLSRFREVLVTSLKAAEIPVPENHGFDPHITLAYIDGSTDVILEGDIPEIPITFSTLDLRIGDEMHSFPFSGKAENNSNDIKVNIAKMDDDQHLVFGWLSISKDEDGQYILDSQGDIIEPEELEKAAYNFALYAREAGEMHRRIGIGKMVESCIFTKEKQEAMGIQPGQIPECAWWIGFHIDDDDTWEKVKKGEYRAFSIGGSAIREAVEIDERSGGIDKHYSGKHDQKTHGRRFGASGQALPKGSKRTFQVNAKGRKEYKETGRLPQGKEIYPSDSNSNDNKSKLESMGPKRSTPKSGTTPKGTADNVKKPKPQDSSKGQGEPKVVAAKELNYEDIMDIDLSKQTKGWDKNKGQEHLYRILDRQGFTGKPHIVSKQEMDKYIKNGERELFRGVEYKQQAEQFQTGDLYAGRGVFGGGTYIATSKTPRQAKEIAAGYAGIDSSGTTKVGGGSVLRMSLRKEAKIINHEDLIEKRSKYLKELIDRQQNAVTATERNIIKKEIQLADDPGMFAAKLGYDAINVAGATEDADYMVILNRTAVRVQKEILGQDIEL